MSSFSFFGFFSLTSLSPFLSSFLLQTSTATHRHQCVVLLPPHALLQHHLGPRHPPHGARGVKAVREPQGVPEGRADFHRHRVDSAGLPGIDRDSQLGHVPVAGRVPGEFEEVVRGVGKRKEKEK